MCSIKHLLSVAGGDLEGHALDNVAGQVPANFSKRLVFRISVFCCLGPRRLTLPKGSPSKRTGTGRIGDAQSFPLSPNQRLCGEGC
jgi:hypothetical protein